MLARSSVSHASTRVTHGSCGSHDLLSSRAGAPHSDDSFHQELRESKIKRILWRTVENVLKPKSQRGKGRGGSQHLNYRSRETMGLRR